MAKNAVSDWDTTAANNTDVGGITTAENSMNPSDINNAFREVMAQIAATDLDGQVVGKSANYTVTTSDNGAVISATASGGAITITLPAAATAGNGFRIVIKKVDSGDDTVTIDADGSENIDDATTYVLRFYLQSVALICDGTQWRVMADSDIFEIGSESTGDYIRFANGFQQCWFETAATATTTQADGSIFRSTTPGSWTYPKAFSGSYPITASAAANNGSRWANVFAVGTSSLSYRQWAGGTSGTGISTYLEAKGRWF